LKLKASWLDSVSERENEMAIQEKPSLYERFGGVYSIATVIDDFIDRIMVDPKLNANAAVDEAHHKVAKAGFNYLVTETVCWAAGGPQTYTGLLMGDSHDHINISGGELDAFMKDLYQTFEKFGVPQGERDELVAIVNGTKGDIVA